MQKLFTCLYGSSLYGTQTPTSDRDVKHIVLPDLGDLLQGMTIKNDVHKTNKDRNVRNGVDDVDEEFIPIQIFARDFLEGQTYALELAFAVRFTDAEQVIHDGRFNTFCAELREKFLTSSMKAMMGYAVNQAELYSDKGERLNAARALWDFLAGFNIHHPEHKLGDYPFFPTGVAPLAGQYPEHIQITTYDQNGKGKMEPCIKVLGRILPYTNSFAEATNTVQKLINKFGVRAKAASATNVDWKATMHALRVINEGVEILTTKNLVLPYEPAWVRVLLLIKDGKMPYEVVRMMIEATMKHLTELEATSTLPKLTHELRQQQDEWLLTWLKEFYL
jgi:hypothetical protein